MKDGWRAQRTFRGIKFIENALPTGGPRAWNFDGTKSVSDSGDVDYGDEYSMDDGGPEDTGNPGVSEKFIRKVIMTVLYELNLTNQKPERAAEVYRNVQQMMDARLSQVEARFHERQEKKSPADELRERVLGFALK